MESLATAVIAVRWRRRSHQSHFLCWYPAAPAKPVGINLHQRRRPSRLAGLVSAHSDRDLLEATPGIEPGIAVLQIPRISPGASAGVRFEIKNELIRPLACA